MWVWMVLGHSHWKHNRFGVWGDFSMTNPWTPWRCKTGLATLKITKQVGTWKWEKHGKTMCNCFVSKDPWKCPWYPDEIPLVVCGCHQILERFGTLVRGEIYQQNGQKSFGLMSIPIGSMYAICGNIYHQYTPNVSIYTIHGSYGIYQHQLCIFWCLNLHPKTVLMRDQRSSSTWGFHSPAWANLRSGMWKIICK